MGAMLVLLGPAPGGPGVPPGAWAAVPLPEDAAPGAPLPAPAAVFSRPQVASVGATEDAVRASGAEYTVKIQEYADVAYGWALEDTTGLCKVLVDPDTHLILGAHLMGPQASTLVQPLIQAMTFGQTADDVAKGQYWIHPALSEVIENALLGLEFDEGAGED